MLASRGNPPRFSIGVQEPLYNIPLSRGPPFYTLHVTQISRHLLLIGIIILHAVCVCVCVWSLQIEKLIATLALKGKQRGLVNAASSRQTYLYIGCDENLRD